MCFLENVVEYQPNMEKEGQGQFGRSFIQKNTLDQKTGVWIADLDKRYGHKREGLPMETALHMLRLDDIVAVFGIKPGDQIDVLRKVRVPNPETGKAEEKEEWQKPFDGEKFKAIHNGELVFSSPEGANFNYNLPVEEVAHIRKHRQREAEVEKRVIPSDSGRDRMSILVEKAKLRKGDSFVFEERRVAEDPKTGHSAERRSWLGLYGVFFEEIRDGHLIVRDATGAGDLSRPLSTYRDIKDIRKAEPLTYPFSERKYLSQK